MGGNGDGVKYYNIAIFYTVPIPHAGFYLWDNARLPWDICPFKIFLF